MCDRIGILNNGNLVALDSTKNLLNRSKIKKVSFKTNKKVNLNGNLKSLNIIFSNINEISLSYDKYSIRKKNIIDLIKNTDTQILDISTDDGDLERCFLSTNKKLDYFKN